ncbi:OmpA/MotB family protein [Caproiciproducens galactitolivorans]|uniref:Flagellar motor protein MotB n=1 Tax=Caproiciproducens galactitolivorans TaxID=642589 RepID=A0ABT4BSW5_9FIRM|nr:flagellar motor protein MotB [Caproiciproducens galactitolivorans]MCY1713036.1 flagellar motor protein MotB [Caproiciproducens galactitolivorans]
MARKRSNSGSGGPNWLDTYSDMVTLLLTFFVMLFAMSTMDASKWQKLAEAFSANKQTNAATQKGGNGGAQNSSSISLPSVLDTESSSSSKGGGSSSNGKVTDFDSLYQYLNDYVNKNGLQDSVHVHKGDNYTFLTFQNSIFFTGDSAELRDEGKKILDFVSDGIKYIPDQIGEIRFYGHTARAGNSTSATAQAFDRALSSDRAKNVLLYVQLKNVIDPAKMVSEGYGEYRPIVPHDGTEAARAKNRRVEIYISKSGQSSSVLDQVYKDINKDVDKEKK